MYNITNFCTFYVGPMLFGIPAHDVQEIKLVLNYTPVPMTPEYIVGVLNLRGQIVIAFDLGKRLNLHNKLEKHGDVFAIVKNNKGPFCIITDKIGDVLEVAVDLVEPVPDSVEEDARNMIDSVYKVDDELLHVLNLENIAKVNFETPDYVR